MRQDLDFVLTFAGLTLGTGHVEAVDGGCTPTPCTTIRATAKSSSFWSMFLKIEDEWVSYYHTDRKRPSYFHRVISEGSKQHNERMWLTDKQVKVETYEDVSFTRTKTSETYDISGYTQDLLSIFMYIRTVPLHAMNTGETFDLHIFYKTKTHISTVTFLGKEEIKTRLGKLMAYKLSPAPPEDYKKEGEDKINAFVWISADKRRLPLYMEGKLSFGTAKLILKKYVVTPAK